MTRVLVRAHGTRCTHVEPSTIKPYVKAALIPFPRPSGARITNRRGRISIVPIVSAFFGIIIRMYFDDHNPPHFHAEHQGQVAVVDFDGRILAGEIDSSTARKLIRQW